MQVTLGLPPTVQARWGTGFGCKLLEYLQAAVDNRGFVGGRWHDLRVSLPSLTAV